MIKKHRYRAFSLAETLAALYVAMCILPVMLSAFGSAFIICQRMVLHTDKVSCAEWWFSRLEQPVSRAALAAMPKTDPTGKMRFVWDAEEEGDGTLLVTLRVGVGFESDIPFEMRVVCRAH